jgi:hypothetical protein
VVQVLLIGTSIEVLSGKLLFMKLFSSKILFMKLHSRKLLFTKLLTAQKALNSQKAHHALNSSPVSLLKLNCFPKLSQ